MKKLVYYIAILVCASVLLSSCVSESLPVCNTIPQFELIQYAGNDSITNDKIYSAKICVFDENDNFINSFNIQGKPELNKIYIPDWEIPQGKYHFCAWINYHENLIVDSLYAGQSRTKAKVGLVIPYNKVIENTENIPFLCYGKLESQEVGINDKPFAIPIMQFTNTINLTIIGLNQSPLQVSSAEGDNYIFSITDNNGTYGYDGDFKQSDNFIYSTNKRVNSDTLNLSLTVMKLSKQRNPTISIKNTDTGIDLEFPENLTDNLVQLILSGDKNNDFDKNHIYNIEIYYNSIPPTGIIVNEIPVTITINDWIVHQFDQELNINK
jgi:hypothetical protein